MKSNTEFIKSVKFFSIIYIFCILLSVINGIGDGDFIKIITLTNINLGDEITVDYTKHDWIKQD